MSLALRQLILLGYSGDMERWKREKYFFRLFELSGLVVFPWEGKLGGLS